MNGIDPNGRFTLNELNAATGISVALGGVNAAISVAAGRSAGYGFAVGALGSFSVAVGHFSGRLGPVLREGIATAIWSTGIEVLADLAEGGWTSVEQKGLWYYGSIAIEGFSWGAFGEAFLSYDQWFTNQKPDWIDGIVIGALDTFSQSIGVLGGLLISSVLFGAGAEAGDAVMREQFRIGVKDAVVDMLSILASAPLTIPAEALSKSGIPGLSHLPPTVRKRVPQALEALVGGGLDVSGGIEAVGTRIADWVVANF